MPRRFGNTEQEKSDNMDVRYELPILSKEQQKVYEELLTKERALLFGVTGSGKTEIFISLMAKTIEAKQQCIFLMPEISLTLKWRHD
jgi:primosomal protein N' (replication factor Y)